jgi:hypothetical protein
LPGPRRRREQGHRGPGVPGARTPADPSGLRPPPSPPATGHRSPRAGPGVASGPCPSRRDSDEPDLPRPIIIIIVLIRSADRAVPLRLVTVRPPLSRLYRHTRRSATSGTRALLTQPPIAHRRLRLRVGPQPHLTLTCKESLTALSGQGLRVPVQAREPADLLLTVERAPHTPTLRPELAGTVTQPAEPKESAPHCAPPCAPLVTVFGRDAFAGTVGPTGSRHLQRPLRFVQRGDRRLLLLNGLAQPRQLHTVVGA